MFKAPASPERLKDATVRHLECGKDRTRQEFSIGQGLSVEVRARSGSNADRAPIKTWIYRYRSPLGRKQRRMTIGTYPAVGVADALRRFRELQRDVQLGNDPWQQERDRRAQEAEEALRRVTVAKLVEMYVDQYARPRKRSWKEDERILHKDVVPMWGDRSITDITRKDVVALLDGVRARGALRGADQVLQIMRKMFNWAIEKHELLPYSPCDRVKREYSDRAHARDRALSFDELTVLLRVLDDRSVSRTTRDALLLQLHTGARLGEVLRMEWTEVDFQRATWSIPASKSKNKYPHLLPLSGAAVDILRGRPRRLANPWVFSNQRGSGPIFVEGVDGQVRKTVLGHPEWTFERFVPHDLRHTVATRLSEMRVDRTVISKILNHRDGSVTGRYVQYDFEREMREALEALAGEYRKLRVARAVGA